MAVGLELHPLSAARTLGFNLRNHLFLPKNPLNQGGRHRVDGSGRVQPLSRVEGEMVGGGSSSQWIGPGDVPGVINGQPGHAFFEGSERRLYFLHRAIQLGGDEC